MKNLQIPLLLVLFSFSMFFGCNNSTEDSSLISDEIIENSDTTISNTQNYNPQALFKLPSPVELFIFMWEDGVDFDIENINSIENTKKYIDTKKKALNLGIYSADLAYCTVYDRNQETMNLFSASKIIAEDLGLTEGFDKTILTRIDKNLDNSDSLYQITNDSYSKTLTFLQAQGQTKILPYIIYGGWVESVYIATQSIRNYKESSEIALRISDQGMLLDNIIDFFISISEKQNTEKEQEIIDQLSELQKTYDKIYDSESGTMSKEYFQEVKTQIAILRNEIVK